MTKIQTFREIKARFRIDKCGFHKVCYKSFVSRCIFGAMKKLLLFLSLGFVLCLTQASAPASIAGPELPIHLIYKRWVISKIDPTGMPTWKDMSEQGKNANLNINRKMIERGSYYDFQREGKANILVFNPFHKGEFYEVPTTYTYSKEKQYITLQEGEKTDENGDTFRVPAMEYKVEKLSANQLVLVVVKNNYKLIFKPAK